jgi:uncharacterized protein (DUF4415 family)
MPKSDLKRLDQMKDEDIDYSDIPPLTDGELSRFRPLGAVYPELVRRPKTRITIRIDDDVLAWFKGWATDANVPYQALINRFLRTVLGDGAGDTSKHRGRQGAAEPAPHSERDRGFGGPVKAMRVPGSRKGEVGQSTAERALQIWESEGRPRGRDLEHWNRAEAEMNGGRRTRKVPPTVAAAMTAASGEGRSTRTAGKKSATARKPSAKDSAGGRKGS